ncbi:MAG: hypothetical protein HPY58_06305 [Firmicutes bacterium]|nr:hypothetical protein [Bacillota bacterium]
MPRKRAPTAPQPHVFTHFRELTPSYVAGSPPALLPGEFGPRQAPGSHPVTPVL